MYFWGGFLLGALLATALLLPRTARAEGLDLRLPGCREHWFGMVTVSEHVSSGKEYNEKHWGPYWRCQFNDRWSNQLGWYPNSFNEDTIYNLLVYHPWRIRRVILGVAGGFGTGYVKDDRGNRDNLRPAFIAGGIAMAEVRKDVHMGFFFNTAVYTLIVEARWK